MEIKEYDAEEAEIMLMFLQKEITDKSEKLKGICNTQTYNIKKGIIKYGNRGQEAINKELSQLHHREVFKPIQLSELTETEKEKAMNSLIFLTEKRDGTLKAKACAIGST